MYSAGEVARYKVKALVIDKTLLEGLLSRYYIASRFAHSSSICSYQSARSRFASLVTKPRPTNHTSQCVIRAYTNTWPDVL